MFMFDKKRDMQTIMSRRKVGDMDYGPGPMKNEDSMEEDRSLDGRHMAAEDMINAFHEKSAHKVKEAMINFMDLHESAKRNENEAEAAGTPESAAADDLSS